MNNRVHLRSDYIELVKQKKRNYPNWRKREFLYRHLFNRVSMESLKDNTPISPDPTALTTSPMASTTGVAPVVFTAPPPMIKLPKFEGSPTGWPALHKLVRMMTDQGSTLTENAKWTHLLKAMKHPEAKCIIENTRCC